MRTAEAFIDTNLLVLLVVGSVDRNQVGKHRRTKMFTSADYDRLLRIIEPLKSVFVTPNILTEASNLLESRSDQRYLNMLKKVVQSSEEIVVASATAMQSRSFSRLGLTDAVLLDVVSKKSRCSRSTLISLSLHRKRKMAAHSTSRIIRTFRAIVRNGGCFRQINRRQLRNRWPSAARPQGRAPGLRPGELRSTVRAGYRRLLRFPPGRP